MEPCRPVQPGSSATTYVLFIRAPQAHCLGNKASSPRRKASRSDIDDVPIIHGIQTIGVVNILGYVAISMPRLFSLVSRAELVQSIDCRDEIMKRSFEMGC